MPSVLLLGAGASFGSDRIDVPPLGAQLFDALREFDPSGWGSLPPESAANFRADFEEAMMQYGNSNPFGLGPLQRAMASYFFGFAPRNSNLYLQLAKRVAARAWPGSICTLNYERLMELSIARAGLLPAIGSPTEPGLTIELCVPHGCCNIFCDGARATGNASFSGFSVTADGALIPVSDPGEYRARIASDRLPPVMCYFEPQKRTTTGGSFIKEQRRRFAALVSQAEKIVAVGIRVHQTDCHIWGPLSQTRAEIVYCSGTAAGEEFNSWAGQARPDRSNSVLRGYFADEFETICRHLEI